MSKQNQMRDVAVLVLGLVLVIGCIVLAHADPQTYERAGYQMRVLTALGGGLIGTTVPGLVGLELKGVRAAGAAAFVVLFYLMAPTAFETKAGTNANAGKRNEQQGAAGGRQEGTRITNSPIQIGSKGQQVTNYDQHQQTEVGDR
jgi:hypothetical protein